MQISSINTILPRYSASFGTTSRYSENSYRSRRRNSDSFEKEADVPTPQCDSVQRGEKRRPVNDRARHQKKAKSIGKKALLFTLAGATAGAIGGNIATDTMIRNNALKDPVAVVEHVSGAPEDLIYEWQINGMTVYPEIDKTPLVSNKAEYNEEQLKNIKNAQNELADVYYNKNNGIVYAVINKDTDVREIKATFGIRMSTDTSVERLNNLYNKETIGADLNTAKIKKGTIIKFERAEAGEKGNFLGSLLNQIKIEK